MSKILIIAGDTSGDIHASKVMKEILIRKPDAKFVGIGGDKMSEIGFEKVIDLSEISVVGFWEVIRQLDKFMKLKSKIKEIIKKENISLFIPVDFPGFNIEIAKICKENNTKVLWYIAPQLWAWGQNRAKKIQQYVQKLLVVFPFEEQFFKEFGINTEFVGNPLMDNPVFSEPIKQFNERDNLLLVMPGSRRQEIELHLPILLSYIDIFKSNYPNFDIVFSIPSHIQQFVFDKYPEIKKNEIESNSYKLMQIAKVGLIKSGTSNLEAALLGLPFVMFYKTVFFNYLIGKIFTKVPNYSIVNILAQSKVVEELIQTEMNLKTIDLKLNELLGDKEKYDFQQQAFNNIKSLLTQKSASKRVAELTLQYLNDAR